ncbi:MAG: nucleotidyltransferase domain-containing protein [bacterium]|nr:nucleotidyltransferase domain-containing protein [bacterium]
MGNKLLNKIVNGIKKYKEVEAIIVFGSYAKGNTKPISDIDIAAIVRNPNPNIEAEIGSFCSKNIDVVLYHRLPLYFQYIKKACIFKKSYST